MSTTMSTAEMVTELNERVPYRLSQAYWMARINEAFRFVDQKGNFIWNQKAASISVLPNSRTFDAPSDADMGKPVTLYSGSLFLPYKPWDDAVKDDRFYTTVTPGVFSCWSFVRTTVPTPHYLCTLFPVTSISTGGVSLSMVYHVDTQEVSYGAGNYFPTPDAFDTLIVELAEAEALRRQRLQGWDIIQKRAESQIMGLLTQYASTKKAMPGLADLDRQVREHSMMRQE